MDDFAVNSLTAARDEWAAQLIMVLTPPIIDGFLSIRAEAVQMCRVSKEPNKYLMTFQNLISRIPQWNAQIIETEKQRIVQTANCSYIDDLIMCVHLTQIKALTAMRVGSTAKKLQVAFPKFGDFVHKVYITLWKKMYRAAYLFKMNLPTIEQQRNRRELELLVREGILETLRESMPIQDILRVYMEESLEEDVEEHVSEEITHEPIMAPVSSVPPAATESVAAAATPIMHADSVDVAPTIEAGEGTRDHDRAAQDTSWIFADMDAAAAPSAPKTAAATDAAASSTSMVPTPSAAPAPPSSVPDLPDLEPDEAFAFDDL